jgi:hypothetical protein
VGSWSSTAGIFGTGYGREVFGGGEGGAKTCKTAREFLAKPGFGISAENEVIAGFGNRYTALLTTEELRSGQQDILQRAIPELGECAQSSGASSFAAWCFPEGFGLPFPCAAHMLPAQHAIVWATQAAANIGAPSKSTVIRHTQAPTILPRAKGKWRSVSMR